MNHRTAMSRRQEPHPKDPKPGCTAELEFVSSHEAADILWETYRCPDCDVLLQTVEGEPHDYNHVVTTTT
jgi:hypothetical protein